MRSLRLGKTPFVRVEDSQVIEDGCDIGMFRTQLLFVNLKRVQIIRLRRLLATRFPEDQRDIVQHRAQI